MVLRGALLYLSRRRWLRRWLETSPSAGRLTRRFVAGVTLEHGLSVCRQLNHEKILVALDHLGENVTTQAEAESSRDSYVSAVREIAAAGLEATVSIKPTQFGMDLGEEFCAANVGRLVEAARHAGRGVEIDMESSEYVDRTLALARALHARYGAGSVRVAVQAYLRRTPGDVETLCREGVPVRLCKGAYLEPETVAFPGKRDVDASYARLSRRLLENGHRPAIATHDPKMIDAALEAARANGVRPGDFEFQMLYGIRRDLQRKLVAGGYRLRLYVPYGTAWYPYFMRRLAERPANLFFLLRNLMRR